MKTLCLPHDFPAAPSAKTWPRFDTWHLVIAAVLVLWYVGATTVFDSNLYVMALWYVLTHCLAPMLMLSAGWIGHALYLRPELPPARGVILRHAVLLLLATVSLPLPLSLLNRIPAGQSTEAWTGVITSCESVHDWGSLATQSRVGVNSKALGPALQFVGQHASMFDYENAVAHGTVVKGFMGVPIAVDIDVDKSILERLRRRVGTAPWNVAARIQLAKVLIENRQPAEARRVIEEGFRWPDPEARLLEWSYNVGLVKEIGAWDFTPPSGVEQELAGKSRQDVRRILANHGIHLWSDAWVGYRDDVNLVRVRWKD